MKFAPYLLVIALAPLISALLAAPEREVAPDASEVARTSGIRVLGATRGYATTGLWVRAGAAYDRGDLYETLATYQLIRELQPRNPAVYGFLAWNQAYNISAQFPDVGDREKWVERGLRTLHEGQQRLPRDASLRIEEWNFILNRSAGYPGLILRVESERYGQSHPAWARICTVALEIEAALNADQRATLQTFLDEYGLQLALFDMADTYADLAEVDRNALLDPAFEDNPTAVGADFHPLERAQMRALFALPPDVLGFLALAHWCRLHAMLIVIKPAVAMRPHGLSIELASINSARLANLRIPPGVPAQEFELQYKEAVAEAFVSGIENALAIGGTQGAEDFLDAMRINFERQPQLLPPEVIDRALQEIQE